MTDRRYVFLYSKQSSDRLRDEGRGGLEDDLDEFLKGVGETTGGGSGAGGWNLDLEFEEGVDLDVWVEKLISFLRRWGVPQDTYLDVNGQRQVSIYSTPEIGG